MCLLCLVQAARVAAVRQASEHYNSELKNRIHRKLEVSQEKRDQQMKVIQERLREHVRVCLFHQDWVFSFH